MGLSEGYSGFTASKLEMPRHKSGSFQRFTKRLGDTGSLVTGFSTRRFVRANSTPGRTTKRPVTPVYFSSNQRPGSNGARILLPSGMCGAKRIWPLGRSPWGCIRTGAARAPGRVTSSASGYERWTVGRLAPVEGVRLTQVCGVWKRSRRHTLKAPLRAKVEAVPDREGSSPGGARHVRAQRHVRRRGR